MVTFVECVILSVFLLIAIPITVWLLLDEDDMDDLLTFGREIEGSLRPGMMRELPNGTLRPVTNREMAAFLAVRRHERGLSQVPQHSGRRDEEIGGMDDVRGGS